MSDGSMYTAVEDAIVQAIKAVHKPLVPGQLAFPADDATAVMPWDGTLANSIEALGDELAGEGRFRIARVYHAADKSSPLEEGQIEYLATFGVLLAVKALRPGAARRGVDVNTIGMNALTHWIAHALHRLTFGIDDDLSGVEDLRYVGCTPVINQRNLCVRELRFDLRVVPKTA